MTRHIQARGKTARIKVLLADGRTIMREGLRLLLEQQADIKVIGEADGSTAAIKLARAMSADVAVLNISLATRGVAQAVREFSEGDEPTNVIIMPLSADAAFVREVLRAGGRGILTKECALDELVTAIRTAAAGQVYLSPRLAPLLVSEDVMQMKSGRRCVPLSSREREIVERIANGSTTKEIAHDLGVSTKTIETHRRRVMEKLNVNSIAELTKYAIRAGLTSLETTL
jgi:two-component system, NarL family, response regulator NreC